MSTTNTKHTPGPWTYREVTENGVFKWSYAIESPVREFDDRSSIVTVAHLTTGIGGEHEANAELIAQAPTMAARIAELEAALAAVTAQRDLCREWIAGVDEYRRTCFEVGDTTAAQVAANMWVAMDGRAALRACDEKRSAEGASIAAEGGAK